MKRMHGTFKGRLVSLRIEDWQKLRERFDPANAVVIDEYMAGIFVSCPLCVGRVIGCSGCTFNKYRKKTRHGCAELMRDIIGGPILLVVTGHSVRWERGDGSVACKELQLLRDALDSMEVWSNDKG